MSTRIGMPGTSFIPQISNPSPQRLIGQDCWLNKQIPFMGARVRVDAAKPDRWGFIQPYLSSGDVITKENYGPQ